MKFLESQKSLIVRGGTPIPGLEKFSQRKLVKDNTKKNVLFKSKELTEEEVDKFIKLFRKKCRKKFQARNIWLMS